LKRSRLVKLAFSVEVNCLGVLIQSCSTTKRAPLASQRLLGLCHASPRICPG